MKIAIASGKGGTGKTTLSVNLAQALAQKYQVMLIDSDVEEPNCNLFMHFDTENSYRSKVPSYEFDGEKCTACGKCAEVCRYNAIAALKTKPMFFPEMCHGCGGCVFACPEKAITEIERENGTVFSAKKNNLQFIEGRLDIGEAMASPLIKKLTKKADEKAITLIDAPPGTACSMFAAVSRADYAILVTEPTPFGLNDFALAVAAVQEMGVPFTAVINREIEKDNIITKFCAKEKIEIIASIPDDRKVAESYSEGKTAFESFPEYRELFLEIGERILRKVQK